MKECVGKMLEFEWFFFPEGFFGRFFHIECFRCSPQSNSHQHHILCKKISTTTRSIWMRFFQGLSEFFSESVLGTHKKNIPEHISHYHQPKVFSGPGTVLKKDMPPEPVEPLGKRSDHWETYHLAGKLG